MPRGFGRFGTGCAGLCLRCAGDPEGLQPVPGGGQNRAGGLGMSRVAFLIPEKDTHSGTRTPSICRGSHFSHPPPFWVSCYLQESAVSVSDLFSGARDQGCPCRPLVFGLPSHSILCIQPFGQSISYCPCRTGGRRRRLCATFCSFCFDVAAPPQKGARLSADFVCFPSFRNLAESLSHFTSIHTGSRAIYIYIHIGGAEDVSST